MGRFLLVPTTTTTTTTSRCYTCCWQPPFSGIEYAFFGKHCVRVKGTAQSKALCLISPCPRHRRGPLGIHVHGFTHCVCISILRALYTYTVEYTDRTRHRVGFESLLKVCARTHAPTWCCLYNNKTYSYNNIVYCCTTAACVFAESANARARGESGEWRRVSERTSEKCATAVLCVYVIMGGKVMELNELGICFLNNWYGYILHIVQQHACMPGCCKRVKCIITKASHIAISIPVPQPNDRWDSSFSHWQKPMWAPFLNILVTRWPGELRIAINSSKSNLVISIISPKPYTFRLSIGYNKKIGCYVVPHYDNWAYILTIPSGSQNSVSNDFEKTLVMWSDVISVWIVDWGIFGEIIWGNDHFEKRQFGDMTLKECFFWEITPTQNVEIIVYVLLEYEIVHALQYATYALIVLWPSLNRTQICVGNERTFC